MPPTGTTVHRATRPPVQSRTVVPAQEQGAPLQKNTGQASMVHTASVQSTTCHVEFLVSAIRLVASSDRGHVEAWSALERSLGCWLEPYEGGCVDAEFIDDTLGTLLSSQVVTSIFHISKMQPEEHTRKSIILARGVWRRVVAAIERAATVAQIRSARRRECMSPCATDLGDGHRSPSASPRFRTGLHGGGALSPTSKCK